MGFYSRASEGRCEAEKELWRRWVHRLYDEYDHICFMYDLHLKRPVITVERFAARWGLWDPLTRTISLSARLIENHPWEVVLEIFKHEIAHQIVCDEYGSDEGHGPCFRETCRRLGMTDWASRAETELGEAPIPVSHEALSGEEKRLLERVEKLLRLANSTNEHEALSAMKKVQELTEKHQLDRLEQKRRAKHVYLVLRTKRKRIERYHLLICSILNEHFFVQVVHCAQYDPHDQAEYKVIELLGTQENVLMAEYVYHFLVQQVDSLWRQYRSRTSKGIRARSSYVLGVLSGFREKLDALRTSPEKADEPPRDSGRRALVAIADRELETFVRERYPQLVNIRRGRSIHDGESFHAGKGDGAKIVLHRAVAETEGSRGGLLPKRT